MVSRPASSTAEGQQLGAMLVGLVQSLKNVQAISGEQAALLVAGIQSDEWYPMSIFFGILEELHRFDIDLNPILFQAGKAFVQDWFTKFDGSTVFSSAKDFILLQADNGGYSKVHRGDPDEIGWLDLLELNESSCRATVVCVTPYPREFERGLFYCGVCIAGDVDYAHVEAVEEPYNHRLTKKVITIHYHRKPSTVINESLDAFLAKLTPSAPASLPEHLQEPMAWRLKAAQEEHQNDRLFYEQSSLLLSRAASRIYDLSKQLDRMAHHDELTNSLNRRAIFERAKPILAFAARNGWPVAFIMVDIDHFKSINDTWGHAVGDEALREVAAVLKGRLRDSDLLGRLGGEEFLIVLPKTALEGASALAESLRAEVEQHTLHIPDTQKISVTISLGIAVADNPDPDEIDTYIMQADKALYQSKNAGRNHITVAAT